MNKNTPQEKKWQSKLGRAYILRNPLSAKEMDKLYSQHYGITRTSLDREFVGNFNRSIKILEVGANTGIQLMLLQKIGFNNLYGLEINRTAIELSKSFAKDIDIIQGSALDIPFKDNYFDLVFTSGLLIHISPKDIKKAMREIHRITKKYIWGFEYYAPGYDEILYRRKKNLLWKTDFPRIYLNHFKDLKLIKEKKLRYLNDENIDTMFLLKKR